MSNSPEKKCKWGEGIQPPHNIILEIRGNIKNMKFNDVSLDWFGNPPIVYHEVFILKN